MKNERELCNVVAGPHIIHARQILFCVLSEKLYLVSPAEFCQVFSPLDSGQFPAEVVGSIDILRSFHTVRVWLIMLCGSESF